MVRLTAIGEHPALHPLQQRGHDVEAEDEQQDPAERGEVDALAGHHVLHRREHVGEVVLALGAQRVGGLLPG